MSLKVDRRPVWVASFTRVSLLMLLLTVGGVSASKIRSWRKYPDLNLWSIVKSGEKMHHKVVTGSDGALWSFGGHSGTLSGELFKVDVETKEWTTITTSGVSPSARSEHSMGSTDGFLWVFGGKTDSGEGEARSVCVTVLATCSVSLCMWSVCGF